MDTCFELQFLLIVCFFLFACRGQNDQFCPVVLEGSPFSYSCLAPRTAEFIIWEVTDDRSVKTSEITRCLVSATDCDSNLKQFSIHSEPVGSRGYNSTLQTTSAVFDYRFLRLTCCYTELSSPPILLNRCKMAVYKDGNTVNCTGKLQQDGAIHLSCSMAYPGISCHYFQRINLGPVKLGRMTGSIRTPEDSTSSRLFEHSCTELLYPSSPGIYTYDFYVEFGQVYISIESSRAVLDVQVKPRVTVGVSPERMPLCQKGTEVELKCNVTFMIHLPTFRFLMGNKEMTDLSVRSFRQGHSEFRTYEAVGVVEVAQEDSNVLISCFVQYSENGKLASLDDTKYLKLSWPPPHPPSFTGVDIPLGNALEIKKGSSSDVICSAKGGEPQVSSIEITCKTGSCVIFRNSSDTSSVSVTIHGNATYNGTTCVCSALHVSNCYNSTTGIQIKVSRLGSATQAPRKSQGTEKTAYIVASGVSLIVIVVVVFFIYKVCRHGDTLYSTNNVYANHIRPIRRCCCCRKSQFMPAESNVAPELPPPLIKPRLVTRTATSNAADPPSLVLGSSAREWRDDPDLEIVSHGEGPCIVHLSGAKAKFSRATDNSTGRPSTKLELKPQAEYLSLLPPKTDKVRQHVPLTSTGYIPMLPPRKKETQSLLGASTNPISPSLSTARSSGELQPVDRPFKERSSVERPFPRDNRSFSSLKIQPTMHRGHLYESHEPGNGAWTQRLIPSAPDGSDQSRISTEKDSISEV